MLRNMLRNIGVGIVYDTDTEHLPITKGGVMSRSIPSTAEVTNLEKYLVAIKERKDRRELVSDIEFDLLMSVVMDWLHKDELIDKHNLSSE
jgi:hypothetical protein